MRDICIYIYMYVCIYMSLLIHVFIQSYVYDAHICIYVYVHTHMYMASAMRIVSDFGNSVFWYLDPLAKDLKPTDRNL